MNHHDLLSWGRSLNYPTIILRRAPKDVLKAGCEAWRLLLSSGDYERIERLRERQEHWQSMYGKRRVE